jgi:hypothetical protein
MASISSSNFAYTARTKSFAAEISSLSECKIREKEPFQMVSARTGKGAIFRYIRCISEDGDVIGWEYISNPPDNPNQDIYKCIIFNT